jgi:hypothetical protein
MLQSTFVVEKHYQHCRHFGAGHSLFSWSRRQAVCSLAVFPCSFVILLEYTWLVISGDVQKHDSFAIIQKFSAYFGCSFVGHMPNNWETISIHIFSHVQIHNPNLWIIFLS